MKTLITAVLMSAALCAQTTVTDTIRVPIGNATFSGKISITAPTMTVGDVTYSAWRQDYSVSNGAFSVTLIPNHTALPAGTSYTVYYTPSRGNGWTETWVVPTSANPVKIASIRSTTTPSTAGLASFAGLSGNPTDNAALSAALAGKAASNASTTVNGQTCALGGSCTIEAGGTWGSIGGTLSDQSDLNAALLGKAASDHNHDAAYAPITHTHLASDITVPVTVSTTSPVSASTIGFYLNNAAGAITYNLPAITTGTVGMQLCFRNATGKSGAITLQLPASTSLDIDGVNGTAAGTFVSGGALGDSACVVAQAVGQYIGYVGTGTWSNN